VSAVHVYSLIRPPRTAFSVDPFAIEISDGDVATVVFAVGDALGDALVRPGRVVTAPRGAVLYRPRSGQG
jgi:hypothetical protein